MNEPIISPWLFYLMEIANNIRVVSFATVALVAILFAFFPFAFFPLFFDWKWQEALPALKKGAFVLGVAGMLLMFVPSSNTIIKMAIASYVTPQNVEYIANTTGKAIDGGIDYVVDKIIEAADKWEQRKTND